jgi:hypothetical protein
MRTSCDRSDIKPKNRAREFLRAYASFVQPASGAINYNRLEYGAQFGRRRALPHFFLRLRPEAARARGPIADCPPNPAAASRAFLSLVEVPKSCHKQGWRVTPFRRGIAQ